MTTLKFASPCKYFAWPSGHFWLLGAMVLALCTVAYCEILPSPDTPINVDATIDERSDVTPAVATDGNGNWVATWSTHVAGRSIIYTARSSDNRRSWGPTVAIDSAIDSPDSEARFPKIATDRQGSWLVVWRSHTYGSPPFGGDSEIGFSRSTDNGASWTSGEFLNSNHMNDGSIDDGEPFIDVDSSGHWVATWNSYFKPPGSNSLLQVALYAVSADIGATWSAPAILDQAGATEAKRRSYEVRSAHDSDGNWVVVWLSDIFDELAQEKRNVVRCSRSTDFGATWSESVSTAFSTRTQLRELDLATDGLGTYVVAWSQDDIEGSTTDYNVYAAVSNDNGLTWDAPTRVNKNDLLTGDSADFAARIATDGTGTWITAWNSSASDSAVFSRSSRRLIAYSMDNGQTWSEPIALSSELEYGEDPPSIEATEDGNWLIAWSGSRGANSRYESDFDIFSTTVYTGAGEIEGEEVEPPTPLLLRWRLKTSAPGWSPRSRFAMTVFQDKLWLLGGEDENTSTRNDVWFTENGRVWQQANGSAPWNPRTGLEAAVLGSAMWIVGGDWKPTAAAASWQSSDGFSWASGSAEVSRISRRAFSLVSFKGKMWTFGGVSLGGLSRSGDISSSSAPGNGWFLEVSDAPWGARSDFAVASLNNFLWLTGGNTGEINSATESSANDIWRSRDAVNWVPWNETPPWQARYAHGSVGYRDRLWVVGGMDSNGIALNDVWYTDDGDNWVRALPAQTPWGPRSEFETIVWKDSVWVVGGRKDNLTGEYTAQVWSASLDEGSIEGENEIQSADQNADFVISLSELLRVISLYNSNGYHCAATDSDTEDGYELGPAAEHFCLPHDADINPQDWKLTLTELLRIVQFYNSGTYYYCPENSTEDSFCPGPP